VLNGQLCRLGDRVDYRTYAHTNHDQVLERAYPDIARWMRERLHGQPAPQTC
jgi:hypothetical protein